MIKSQNINPKRNIYYLGAVVVLILYSHKYKSNAKRDKATIIEADFFEVFQELKQKEEISINLFVLTLDWLFILNIIQMDGNFILIHY